MTYDLRLEPWLPLRRLTGEVEWATIADLTDKLATNPFVAVATPRPDFDGAVTEFLVGMLAAAFEPADEDEWQALWETPPSPASLTAALARLPDAFELLSHGAAFFQDFDAHAVASDEPFLVEQLLLDAPGDQSRRLNKDHFIKRDLTPVLGRPAAAMALLTLQTYAPSGGAGHRVSLRGGGPLTTLVEPRPANDVEGGAAQALWCLLWANVPTRHLMASVPNARRMSPAPKRFPWLGPTRTSQKIGGEPTFPEHSDSLQCFFGLPRRIRLRSVEEAGTCALTGRTDSHMVTGFDMLPWGTQYQRWIHPLTPYYVAPKGAGLLPVHGQSTGLGWRDWLGLVLGDPDATRQPAVIVSHFAHKRRFATGLESFRIKAFGYDFDNMKARSWVASDLPAFAVSADVERELRFLAHGLVEATSLVASLLHGAIGRALSGMKELAGEGTDDRARLWDALEAPFFEEIASSAADADSSLGTAPNERFLGTLRREALRIFDTYCSFGEPDPTCIRRVVAQRRSLSLALAGFGAMGAKLRNLLHLPPVERKSPKRSSKNTVTRRATP